MDHAQKKPPHETIKQISAGTVYGGNERIRITKDSRHPRTEYDLLSLEPVTQYVNTAQFYGTALSYKKISTHHDAEIDCVSLTDRK